MDYSDIIKLLSDSYKLRILTSAKEIPRSAGFISVMLNVPISVSYRCLDELEKQGLVGMAERPLTPEGIRVSHYRSWLREIEMTIDEGEIVYRVLFRGGRGEMRGSARPPSNVGTKD